MKEYFEILKDPIYGKIIFVLIHGLLFWLITSIKQWYLFIGLLIAFYIALYFYYPYQLDLYFFGGILAITVLLLSGVGSSKNTSVKESFENVNFETAKGKLYGVKNVFRGIVVFGASGSGKTASVLYTLIRHFHKFNFGGVVYDYKDGELTELLVPLYKDKLKIMSFHRPDVSVRFNPISPKYMVGENDVNSLSYVLISNLSDVKERDFFIDTGTALLSAIILKFSLSYPKYCYLPYVISFILAVDFEIQREAKNSDGSLGEESFETFGRLKDFLLSDPRVKIQASSFIMGLASSRQTASVISTLANSIRQISSPESFYILTGDELDLQVNKKDDPNVISIMNLPKDDEYYTPLIAMTVHILIRQMMQRDSHRSFILLDEAPTIKLRNMAKIPATMRSFGVATVYCAQDVIQGTNQYGKEKFKEILTNLSTQFFGKSNDPDSSKFYEMYFPLVKVKSKSYTKKGEESFLDGGAKSTTTSEKEQHKFRIDDFGNLVPGQFAFKTTNVDEIIQLKEMSLEKDKLPKINNVTKEELINNYYRIINEINVFAEDLFNGNLLEEQPAVKPKEEQPAVKPKEEQPAVEPKEEQPAVEPKEEQPAVKPKEEQPAVEPKEEQPAVKPKENILEYLFKAESLPIQEKLTEISEKFNSTDDKALHLVLKKELNDYYKHLKEIYKLDESNSDLLKNYITGLL